MKWRTEITSEYQPKSIDYQSHILLMGSCFAENIGELMENLKFEVQINPLGICYNPYSILQHLKTLSKHIDPASVKKEGDRYYHFDFHGRFSSTDKEEVLEQLAVAKKELTDFLQKTTTVIISLGTAYVFEEKEHGIVNNCHKIPQKKFQRRILSYSEVEAILKEIHAELKIHNPSVQLIYTVSPVKHIRDGLVNNRRSKSILHAAIHEAISHDENMHYFPSYEMVVDVLRDYRLYAADLIHPSSEAIKYIWTHFKNSHLSDSCITEMQKVEKILRAVNHRPIDASSADHLAFLKATLKEIEGLPTFDFERERGVILSQM